MSELVAIKTVFNQDVRRFTLPANSSFAGLLQEVTARFGLAGRVVLRYKDDESEMCTIASDDELREAIRLAALATPPVLRVQIAVEVEAEATAPTELSSLPVTLNPTARLLEDSLQQFCNAVEVPVEKAVTYLQSVNVAEETQRARGLIQPVVDMLLDAPRAWNAYGAPRAFGKAGRYPWRHGSVPVANGLSSRFVADVTIADGTRVAASERIVKTWRLRNDGEKPWPETCGLVFVKGDVMHEQSSVLIGAVQPGAEVDVSVPLIAPPLMGRFVGYWRLSTAGEAEEHRQTLKLLYPFGQRVWVQLVVVGGESAARASEDCHLTVDSVAQETAEQAKDMLDALAENGVSMLHAVEAELCRRAEPAMKELYAADLSTQLERNLRGPYECVAKHVDNVAQQLEPATSLLAEAYKDPMATFNSVLSSSASLVLKAVNPNANPVNPDVGPIAEEHSEHTRRRHPDSEPSVDRGDELFEDAVDRDPDTSDSCIPAVSDNSKTQVALLVEMGFADEAANLDALLRADGNVEGAIEILTWEATEVL